MSQRLTCMGDVCAGVLMTRAELEQASELCRRRGTWLVVDDTYEHFTYDGRQHVCVAGPHILHMFSFSKARTRPRALAATK